MCYNKLHVACCLTYTCNALTRPQMGAALLLGGGWGSASLSLYGTTITKNTAAGGTALYCAGRLAVLELAGALILDNVATNGTAAVGGGYDPYGGGSSATAGKLGDPFRVDGGVADFRVRQ